MKQIAFALFILVLASLACLSSASPQTADEYFEEYGGKRDVYYRILSESDCTELQHQFDLAASNNETAESGTAEARWTLGYMKAADQRMKEIGCYE